MKNIVLILSFSFLNCTTPFEYQIANNKEKKYDKVSLINIINNPLDYDNKDIEVEGFYYSSMEQSTIVALKDSKKGLWVDLSSSLSK